MTKNLREIIADAEKRRVAIGHFNISEITALKAIVRAAKEIKVPVIVGVSEGERDFVGVKQIAALIKSLREEDSENAGGYPIFLNADHTKSLEKIKEAVEAGFDAVMFDGSKLPLEENIKKTKEVVEYVKNFSVSRHPPTSGDILVSAELGYIRGTSSILRTSDVHRIKKEDLTKIEEAEQFVKETGVDLLAPAVGNIHGIVAQNNADMTQIDADNPPLDIKRIKEIKKVVGIPLVLHGGSGIKDEEILAAIDAGISIIHINTEVRLAWRKGLESALKDNKEEISPYKILSSSEEAVYEVVKKRLELFNASH